MKKILIVDDEQKVRHILQIMLEQNGYKSDQAANGEKALDLIRLYHYSMVLTDLKMPGMDGMTLLKEIKKIDPDIPVIVITAYGSICSAVEATREDALDYITKPFEEKQILVAIERSGKFSEILEEKRIYRAELSKFIEFNNIVAESQQMLHVIKQAAMVAKSPNTTVLLLGESGTGKELITNVIHYNSSRGKAKMMAINCAAIAPTLIESELFGHEKGAFTGAEKTKQGKLEVANGGTVFLDEVGDLSLEAQAKLLRFLQEKEFERVGGTNTIQADVRIIGATNKDLKQLVDLGKFREDLYYRLNVFPLRLPPLSERLKDIIPLAEHFLKKYSQSMGITMPELSDSAKRVLFKYHWPGNVRELENAIERSLIISGGEGIGTEHLNFLRTSDDHKNYMDEDFILTDRCVTLEEFELDLVKQALERSNDNQLKAAQLLGVSRGKIRTLVKRLTSCKASLL
jgi:DNA-binding NtrC family response regulator